MIRYRCYRCSKPFSLSNLIKLDIGCIPVPVTEDWMSGAKSLPSVFCKKCADIEIKEYQKMENTPGRGPYRNNCPGSYFG